MFHVYIEPIPVSSTNPTNPTNGILGASSCGRSLNILTDTIQAALLIGKSKCMSNEQVVSVSGGTDEVHIDYSVIQGKN
jgi:hypothetical protein